MEHIYQASHLNIKEGVSSYGTQMLLQSTLFSRLGVPHVANAHCELLLDCYGEPCPIDERIRAVGRRAFIMSQNGRYNDAIATLEAIDPAIHKSLKYHQYLVLCIGVIKFKRAIRRYEFYFFYMFRKSQPRTDLTGRRAHTCSLRSSLSPPLTHRRHHLTPSCLFSYTSVR
jgi:anaphase-promoting complex subunit 5